VQNFWGGVSNCDFLKETCAGKKNGMKLYPVRECNVFSLLDLLVPQKTLKTTSVALVLRMFSPFSLRGRNTIGTYEVTPQTRSHGGGTRLKLLVGLDRN
jgi:hypothetical protein